MNISKRLKKIQKNNFKKIIKFYLTLILNTVPKVWSIGKKSFYIFVLINGGVSGPGSGLND
jgi:hypothetical protein